MCEVNNIATTHIQMHSVQFIGRLLCEPRLVGYPLDAGLQVIDAESFVSGCPSQPSYHLLDLQPLANHVI